jgi:hypothetical protein
MSVGKTREIHYPLLKISHMFQSEAIVSEPADSQDLDGAPEPDGTLKDGAPEPDGTLKAVARKRIIHYRQLYIDRPEPIAFMPVAVDTSGRIYADFLRLLFLHAHRSQLTCSGIQ